MSRPKEIDLFVGRQLQTQRIAMGLSTSDLAEAIQTSTVQIDTYEQGEARIGAAVLIRLSEILGVRLSYFFQGA
jgi:transcriptional regulator with XRE-family HTH domain